VTHVPDRLKSLRRNGSYALLAALLVEIFILPPLVTVGTIPRVALAIASTATLGSAFVALGGHKALRGLAAGAALVALAAQWTHIAFGANGTEILSAATFGLATAIFGAMVLVDVFSKGKLPDRLLAVLLTYLLLGTVFAEVFHVLDIVRPGAIAPIARERPISTYIYFSFSTLTSVGYGDVVAVHPLGRSFAVLEALAGQIYTQLVISRYVGEQAATRPSA